MLQPIKLPLTSLPGVFGGSDGGRVSGSNADWFAGGAGGESITVGVEDGSKDDVVVAP